MSASLLEATDPDLATRVAKLVEARKVARKAKNFKESDRIRDELVTMGIALMDSKDPETGELVTTWEVRGDGSRSWRDEGLALGFALSAALDFLPSREDRHRRARGMDRGAQLRIRVSSP